MPSCGPSATSGRAADAPGQRNPTSENLRVISEGQGQQRSAFMVFRAQDERSRAPLSAVLLRVQDERSRAPYPRLCFSGFQLPAVNLARKVLT